MINACRDADEQVKQVLQNQLSACLDSPHNQTTQGHSSQPVDSAAQRQIRAVGMPLALKALQDADKPTATLPARLLVAMEQCQQILRQRGLFRTAVSSDQIHSL